MIRHVVRSGFAAAMLMGMAITGTTAQEATPEASPVAPSLPPGCAVVADGLRAPRFVAIAGDGTMYVTEAGLGGAEVFPDPLAAEASGEATPVPQISLASPLAEAAEAAATPGPAVASGTPLAEQEATAAPTQTRGYSGRVSKIAPDGTQSVLAEGFASYSGGVGPSGIAIGPDGQIYIAVGGSAVLAGLKPLDTENTVIRIDPATGEVTAVAELGQYEVDHNPDGTDVNPNLYGVTFGADGMLYVADAGGNTIYRVDTATGDYSLFAIIPGLAPSGDATPVDPSAVDRQPVPTGLKANAAGELYVPLLSEAWPKDATSLYRIATDASLTSVADGLYFAVALSFGPDDTAYVTQLFTSVEGGQPGPGAVFRIGSDGTAEPVLEGLAFPHGTAFDAEGNLYVVTGSVVTGPGGPPGQLLRCEGVAAGASATPTT